MSNKYQRIVRHGPVYNQVKSICDKEGERGRKLTEVAEELTVALVEVCLNADVDLEVAHKVIDDFSAYAETRSSEVAVFRLAEAAEA
ncbi:MAG: hypothetical protein P1V36_00365 [Planctomycetota bacterium]|nr:hypothetical protein [Planctomycetota bacterium]